MLRCHLLGKEQGLWVERLSFVEFAINANYNVSTGFSPFRLVYGEEVHLPIDHMLHSPAGDVFEIASRAAEWVEQARHNLEKA